MKKLFSAILGIFGVVGCSQQTLPSNDSDPYFVFVKIPESIMPIDRGDKYEDPLDAVLKSNKLGEITGGGSQMSHPDENGNRTIEWVGIDVDLYDLDTGIPFLKAELIKLGVPEGTVLEFRRNEDNITEPVK